IPDFSFVLYATDAQGNRDSVTIGYGPNATILLDQTYNEIDITAQPFDSVFEIRTGFSGQPSGFQSKTQITDWTCNSTFNYQIIGVSIHAVHYPVVLSWDMDRFESVQNPCHKASVLVEDFLYFNFPMLSFAPVGMSSSTQTTLQSDFGATTYTTQLNSGNEGEVKVIYFGLLERPLSGTVSIEENVLPSVRWTLDGEQLRLQLPVHLQSRVDVSHWDIWGKEISLDWILQGHEMTARIGHLSPGIYIIQVKDADGLVETLNWIKK
ncbi:MAG: hypothetical protein AAFR59_10390, partial [Bacteroidota bacterium]